MSQNVKPKTGIIVLILIYCTHCTRILKTKK